MKQEHFVGVESKEEFRKRVICALAVVALTATIMFASNSCELNPREVVGGATIEQND